MLALLVVIVAIACAAPIKDRVVSLPGWNGPLPSAQYSGLIDIGTPPSGVGRMFMHYWFMESENDPSTDPVIVWYNGGPGASSMFGILTELGPLQTDDLSLNGAFNSTGVPQLVRNPYAWTKLGNVLMVDNEPPVGFSYCTQFGPTGNGTSCGSWNDTLVAQVNAVFYREWFRRFPEFRTNPLYFTGESYAGVYVPVIVREILAHPEYNIPPITGVALGDGCLGVDVLCSNALNLTPVYWDLMFFYGHGQLSNAYYDQVMQVCGKSQLMAPTQTGQCKALVDQMPAILGNYYEYNLEDYCPENVFGKRRRRSVAIRDPNPIGGPIVGYVCIGAAMNDWVALPEVRRALNVPVDSNFFNSDNGVGFVYNVTEPDVRLIALKWLETTNMRVLIYNGDTDPSLSSFRTQDAWFPFMEAHGYKQTQPWRAWTTDGKQDVRGYVTEWLNNRFAFLTIRGSGHMVPQYRSQAAFSFLQRWLSGSDYPKYVPSSSAPRRRVGI